MSGAHSCDKTNGYCENTIGSYKCSCKQGYHGDGTTCSLHTYSVEGTVIDASTGKAIPNSLVSLESLASLTSHGREKTKADKFGQFMFTVGSGNYTISASKKRYITNTRNVSVSDNIERGTRADIFLSRKLARGKSNLIYTIAQVDFTVIFL